ncbi:MAG: ABC transporter substrate-binding protein [Dehalococcoidia bacterium]|nr:ABC transporter substrate-binding protein [Dehalococcoidia bacterium]
MNGKIPSRLAWSLAAVGLAVAVGCAPAAPAPTATPAAKPTAQEKPVAPATPAPKPPEKAISPSPVPGASKLKVGNLSLTGEGGVYVAMEKGYFKEENLEVELVPFRTGAEQVAALAGGELDVGYLSPDAGLFNAMLRGIALKIVMSSGMGAKGGQKAAAVVQRKDLFDAGTVKSPADLKGRTVAITGEADASAIGVATALARGGLTFKDVKLVTMGFPDIMAAFGNKAIDAGWEVEPFLTMGREQGFFVPWIYLGDLRPLHDSVVYAYSAKFAAGNPGAARGFAVALLKGNRDYNEAFFGSGKGKAEVIAALVKQTSVKDPAMYEKMGLAGAQPNGAVSIKSLLEDIDWYVANGQMKEKASIETFVDTQYVEYALSKLGKVPE